MNEKTGKHASKKPTKRASTSWSLKGVKASTRRATETQAKREGVSTAEYVDMALQKATQSKVPLTQAVQAQKVVSTIPGLAKALERIEQRLDGIESQQAPMGDLLRDMADRLEASELLQKSKLLALQTFDLAQEKARSMWDNVQSSSKSSQKGARARREK